MKQVITFFATLMISTLAAASTLPTISCEAGLIGLGSTINLSSHSADGVMVVSGHDAEVQVTVRSESASTTLEIAAINSNQSSLHRGPALGRGQELLQILQLQIEGATTAYMVRCFAN